MKAVIFDLDGTVIDSMGAYEATRLQMLYKCAPQLTSKELLEIEDKVSLNSEAFIDYVNENYRTNIDNIIFRDEVRKRVYNKYKTGFPLKKGFLEFLDYLDDKNIAYCLATASNNDNAEAIMKTLNLDNRFEFILTTYDVNASKLKPDIYIEAAKKLNEDVEDVVVFEDAPHAAITAKDAGFSVVVIEDDYFIDKQEKLKDIGDYYFESYDDLLEYIDTKKGL